jgi:CHAT domain-containing protein
VYSAEKHFSPEQVEWLINGKGSDAASEAPVEFWEEARQHLARCTACEKLVHLHGEIDKRLVGLKGQRTQLGGENCPDQKLWWEVAAGILPKPEAEKLISHAIQCDHCAPLFKEATEDLASAATPQEEKVLQQLRSDRADWQNKAAQEMAVRSRQTIGQRAPVESSSEFIPGGIPAWRLIAAACVLLAIALSTVWIIRRLRQPSINDLLASAYSEQRTLEMRIPAASYAPVRQERGAGRSSLAKPSSLLRAEYLISEKLSTSPEDAEMLAAKGRAEILEWQYSQAIESLKHSLDLSAESPELDTDLATAYVERAEAENRPLDYGEAIEYLGKALGKNPEDQVAIYNRAIVEEKLKLYEQALKDWEHYLQIDSAGPWSAEARQRLEETRQHLKDSGVASPLKTEPADALADISARHRGAQRNSQAQQDSADEEYLQSAVTSWLLAIAGRKSHPPPTVPENTESAALIALSTVLHDRHGDSWLSDILSTNCISNSSGGLQDLGASSRLNLDGSFDAAAISAEHSARAMTQINCRPATLRALWEKAYAFQRAQQGGECLDTIQRARKIGISETYPWLAAQFDLEESICSAMTGRLSTIRDKVKQSIEISESAHYPSLILRATQIAGTQIAPEGPAEEWAWLFKGIQLHWAGTYHPFRVYQFYAEMALSAENRQQWHLARTLMEEAVVHIGRTSNHLTEAVAVHNLAVDTKMTGDDPGALAYFRRASELFSSLPQSPLTRNFLFSAGVYQASLEAQQGKYDLARESLRTAHLNYSEQSQYWVWLHYYQALAEVLFHQGDQPGTERALRSALYISETALGSLANDSDRLQWERRASPSYRSLVELHLAENNSARALESWEWYLSSELRVPRAASAITQINFSSVDSAPPLRDESLVSETLPNLKTVTILSFAKLNTGVFVWLFDDRGIHARRLSVSESDLNRISRRFLSLCRDPSSNRDELFRAGKLLYGWLIDPLSARLNSSRTLVIESDGSLEQLPFAALVSPDGRYLGQQFRLVISPGLGFWPELRATKPFSSRDRALIVGVPDAGPDSDANLSPLPDAAIEAREVSSHFSRSTLLLGTDASVDSLRRDLPSVSVFHFAGHAISTASRSGLVLTHVTPLAGDERAGAGFFDARQIRMQKMQGLGLAVLSACATAVDDSGLVDSQSLVHAFLRAGIPQVIASGWNVDSHSTAALMQQFYKGLLDGRTAPEALRIAADAVRSQPQTSHPYYWASFSVYGKS